MDSRSSIAIDDVPPPLQHEQLTANPRFAGAVDVLIDGMANLYGEDRRLIRSLFEYSRAVTFGIAIGLALSQDADDPDPGFSVRALADAAAQMNIGRERRVRRIVGEFRADGLLDTLPHADDARRQRLMPSERMLAIDREWLAVFHRHLVTLFPDEPRYARAIAGDRDYQRRFRRTGLQTLGRAMSVMRNSPEVDFFMHQTSGARLLAVLLQMARDGDDGWTPPGFYTIAARRCAATRVHVRQAMRDAAAQGLVEIDSDADLRVRPTAALGEAFARWTADTAVAMDYTSYLATR